MIWTGALILGAVVGTLTAKRRGGKMLDLLQYGAVYAIAFGLAGLAIGILLDRMG